MGWGPVDWVGRVLPEAKFENKWTLFFYFLYLSDQYWDICKKQFLGTSWMGWGPVDWVGRVLPEAKFKNKWTLFFDFFWFERPTHGLTDLLAYQLTGVGSRDTCVSKKGNNDQAGKRPDPERIWLEGVKCMQVAHLHWSLFTTAGPPSV